MLIGDVVKRATGQQFTNDVRIEAFYDPALNVALSNSYYFTSSVPNSDIRNTVSSVDVLQRLVRSAQTGGENRHTVIATYGHGKSHLGVIIANFFGNSVNSDEFEIIRAKLEVAAGPECAEQLVNFRLNTPPYLVVTLKGDHPANLREQVIKGLDKAIQSHPAAITQSLTHWFREAERILADLDASGVLIVEDALRSRGISFNNLIEMLNNRQQEAYEPARAAIRAATHVTPDLGGENSLQEVIHKVVETYCKCPNPVVGGILFLFDEFGAFIDSYAQRQGYASVNALQDLLNGVSACRGYAQFISFSQQDPDSRADSLAKVAGGDMVATIKKELGRLPRAQRYSLYTTLETVISGYLHQDERLWEEISSAALDPINVHAAYTRSLLAPRYDDDYGWRDSKFDEIMVQRCFPLHPLTTGIFCKLSFKNNSRQVLNFVMDAVDDRLAQPAIINDCPGWIYATTLVDYFGDALTADDSTLYDDYQAILQQAGAELPLDNKRVLQSILLYHMAKLKLGRDKFERAVSTLCGLPQATCLKLLQDMEKDGYVLKHSSTKCYHLDATGHGAHLERLLRAAAGKYADEPWNNLPVDELSDRLPSYPADGISWGMAGDWIIRQRVMSRRTFVPDELKRIAPTYKLLEHSWHEGKRGLIIRLVAESDDDVQWLNENALSLLDQAFGTTPPAVVVIVPKRRNTELLVQLRYRSILQDSQWLDQNQIRPEAIARRRERNATDLQTAIIDFVEGGNYVLPSALDKAVKHRTGSSEIRLIVSACLYAAYHSSKGRQFFTQHSAAKLPLRKAIAALCPVLMTATVEQFLKTSKEPMVADLVTKILTSWTVISKELNIMEPTNTSIAAAWKVIDDCCPVGATSCNLTPAFTTLLNAPFGFDFNQLALLCSAWLGFHRLNIKCATNLSTVFAGNPNNPNIQDALAQLAEHMITRELPQARHEKVTAILDELARPPFTVSRAREFVDQLQNYADAEDSDVIIAQRAKIEADRLRKAAAQGTEYADRVAHLTKQAQLAPNAVDNLMGIRNEVTMLVEPKLVLEDNWPTTAIMLNKLDEMIRRAVEQLCISREQLPSISDYSKHLSDLESLQLQIAPLKVEVSNSRITQAIANLKSSLRHAQDKQQDEAVLKVLDTITTRTNLHTLRTSVLQLRALNGEFETTKTAISEKLDAVTSRIHDEEAQVRTLLKSVDAINSRVSASTTLESLIGDQSALRDEPEFEEVGNAIVRARKLKEYYDELGNVDRRVLKRPDEADDVRAVLDNLQEKYSEWLNDQQRTSATAILKNVLEQVAAATAAANNWLNDLKARGGSGGNTGAILRELRGGNPFLPLAREDERRALIAELEAAAEKDEVHQITERFRRIGNRKTREQVIEALRKLLAEMEG